MCAVFPALRACFGKLVLNRCGTGFPRFSVFTHLMVLGLLITALMDGLNTDTNVSASPVAAYWCPLQPGMSHQSTERMIDDFQEGLVWNERCYDWGSSLGFVSELFYFWGGVCLYVSTRTSRREQTAVWPAFPATPSVRSSSPAWVTDLCAYSTGGWVQMIGKKTPFLQHRTLTQRRSDVISPLLFFFTCVTTI